MAMAIGHVSAWKEMLFPTVSMSVLSVSGEDALRGWFFVFYFAS